MSGDSSNPKSQIIDSTHDHLYDRDKLVPVSYSKQMAVRILPSEPEAELPLWHGGAAAPPTQAGGS